MSAYPLWVLTSSIDEGIMYWLAFRARDETHLAQHLLNHAWMHRRLFHDLRIDMEDVCRLTPAALLNALRSSHVDGDSDCGFRILRIDEKDITVVADEQASNETPHPAQHS